MHVFEVRLLYFEPIRNPNCPITKDIFKLFFYDNAIYWLSNEWNSIGYVIMDACAFWYLFKCMDMLPGSVRAAQLDVSETHRFFIIDDLCPPPEFYPKPPDCVMKLSTFKHICVITVDHSEIEPLRGNLREISRVLSINMLHTDIRTHP